MAIIVPNSITKSVSFTLLPGERIYAEVRLADGTKKTELMNDQCDPTDTKNLSAGLTYGGQLV
jgi:hypothetical protein